MSKSNLTVFFFGTPDFACVSLQALLDSTTVRVLGVATQPDRPAARGQKLTASPVKKLALGNSLPVFQPKGLASIGNVAENVLQAKAQSAKPLIEFLNETKPDIGVVVAYGVIIPQALLEFFPLGLVNVHASILPRWRGAAPLQRAILAGDAESGVSIMKLEEGLDTGPTYSIQKIALEPEETLGSLHDKLSALGARALLQDLPRIATGELQAQPQSSEGVSYAEKWDSTESRLDWSLPPELLSRKVRAIDPVPGAKTTLGEELVKIFKLRAVQDRNYPSLPSGTIVEVSKTEVIVSCGISQYVCIDEIQFPGRRRLRTAEALQGRALQIGQRFT